MAKKLFLVFVILSGLLFAQHLMGCYKNQITSNPGESLEPAIAIDSIGNLHVVWGDDTPGNSEIFHKMSTDGGTTWTPAQRLTWNSGDSTSPVIAIDSSNNIFVVWQDFTPGNWEIYFKRSFDGGATWSAAIRLTWNSGESSRPAIAIDTANHIHVVFQDSSPGNFEIFYRKSTNGGLSWSPNKRLTWNAGGSYAPKVATDSSNNIIVVWHDFSGTPGAAEIHFKKSTDGGTSWAGKRLTWNPGASGAPDIAIDPANVIHIFWMDSTPGNAEIFHKQSSNGGLTWITKKVTWSAGTSWHPDISIDGIGSLHLVWKDDTSGNLEIYYKNSTDGGATWATERLTWNTGSSDNPDVAVYNFQAHFVWDDDTHANKEIFYTNR
jgi:hypothetical protein